MFEIYYLPMHVEMGLEQPETPGMFVCVPPRRAQRSRAQDMVGIYLDFKEGALPPARFIENMLDDTISRYYYSSGSTTNGLKTAAEYLNSQLLQYNTELQANRSGVLPALGVLNMFALKGEVLSLMHVGPTCTWLLQPSDLQPYENKDEPGKGLGFSRTISPRFFQTSVTPECIILFCTDPVQNWTETELAHGSRLTINLLRRRLLASEVDHFKVGILQFKTSDQRAVYHLKLRSLLTTNSGEYNTNISTTEEIGDRSRVKSPVEDRQVPRESFQEPSISQKPLVFRQSSQPTDSDIPEFEIPFSEPPILDLPDNETPGEQGIDTDASLVKKHGDKLTRAEEIRRRAALTRQDVSKTEESNQEKTVAEAEKEPRHSENWQVYRMKLAAAFQSLHKNHKKIDSSKKTLFTHMLPGVNENSPKFSNSLLLLIAVLIPALVVFAAVSIYTDQGRDKQHKLYLDQASAYAVEARKGGDSDTVQYYWEKTIFWLDYAENYEKSDESLQLRAEANAAMDAMGGVERLDFENLYAYSFSDDYNFVQIAANDRDVYLLDSVSGNVLRLSLTGQGYKLDNEFSCGPGYTGTQMFGKIVDLVALPTGSSNNATVLAVDDSGDVMYCIPGAPSPLTSSLPVPEDGWGKIKAISLYQGDLYVLDSGSGDVYYFYGFTSGYSDTAVAYFDPARDTNIPELDDVIDLSANEEELYLLHQNGTIAHCTAGIWESYQTTCDDPASFGDMRAVQSDDTLLFKDVVFTQMQTTTQPEPSLYILDTYDTAIYRFSLQLNLDRLFKPTDTDKNVDIPITSATAFTISSNREVFLAYGNDVFFTSLAK